jgi:hypothetical protein
MWDCAKNWSYWRLHGASAYRGDAVEGETYRGSPTEHALCFAPDFCTEKPLYFQSANFRAEFLNFAQMTDAFGPLLAPRGRNSNWSAAQRRAIL